MVCFIFDNCVDKDTNWLNPAWRKAKTKELVEIKQLSDIMDIELKYPSAKLKTKADLFGCNTGHYCTLRRKYNVRDIIKGLK